MSAALVIHNAGPGVTLQDAGRHGYLRFGVSEAGPMDPLSFSTANLAAGNIASATAIEISLGGLDITAEGGIIPVAIAGGNFNVSLDGNKLPHMVRLDLKPGARLSIRPGPFGMWTYLAIGGRIDIPSVLNSNATHTRSGLGGLTGRGLVAGDRIPISAPRNAEPGIFTILAPWLERPSDIIRVMLGPQEDYFDPDQISAFLQCPWTVSVRSDRMGYALEGPKLSHAKGFNIVSDGIAMGAIQIPGDGRPVVLMADRQPTGGYPKIANVIGSDLGRLAQLRPGSRFRFAAVSFEEAIEARKAEQAALASSIVLEPLTRESFSAEFLLALNLVDGVTAGADEVSP